MDTQDQIVAAAKRMKDAGVIIDCEPADDWLDIDATSLDGLSDEGVFFLEGEAAATSYPKRWRMPMACRSKKRWRLSSKGSSKISRRAQRDELRIFRADLAACLCKRS
jgi:hypothetical protein